MIRYAKKKIILLLDSVAINYQKSSLSYPPCRFLLLDSNEHMAVALCAISLYFVEMDRVMMDTNCYGPVWKISLADSVYRLSRFCSENQPCAILVVNTGLHVNGTGGPTCKGDTQAKSSIFLERNRV